MERTNLDNLRAQATKSLSDNSKIINDNNLVKKLVENLSVYQEELEAQKSELEQAQLGASALAEQFSLIFDLAPVGYIILDNNGDIIQHNQKANEILCIGTNDAYGSSFKRHIKFAASQRIFDNWVDNNLSTQIDLKLRCKPLVWIQLQKAILQRPESYDLTLITIVDVTERRSTEEFLQSRANFDLLTGLPNRLQLVENLRDEMQKCDETGNSITLVYIDLDDFKYVNDQYTHRIGDELILRVSNALKSILGLKDIIGRFGGDEFVIIIKDNYVYTSDTPFVQKVLKCINDINVINDNPISISASVGITQYPQSGSVDAEQLVRQADSAMYRAKNAGKNTYKIFDINKSQAQLENANLRKRVINSIARQEFELIFQPITNLVSNEVQGFEANIIPNRSLSNKNILSSDYEQFIKCNDTIKELDNYLLVKVLCALSDWQQAGYRFNISLKLSIHSLKQHDFIKQLLLLSNKYPEAVLHQLTFQVTALNDIVNIGQIVKVMNQCKIYGIKFAIYNYGSSCCSIDQLQKLPICQFYIGQSYTLNIDNNKREKAIVESLLILANALDIESIAGGVNSPSQLSILTDLNCKFGKGSLFGEMFQYEQVIPWLESQNSNLLKNDKE